MTTSEGKKTALIIFHVVALMLLFISVSLVLDQIFTQGANGVNHNYFALNFEYILAIITILIASISWMIIIMKWIRNGHLDYYLKSIFIAKSLLILGLIVLLIV